MVERLFLVFPQEPLTACARCQVDFDHFSQFMTNLLKLKFAGFDVDGSGVVEMNEINALVDCLLGRVSSTLPYLVEMPDM